MADGGLLEKRAEGQHLLGEQWGMMNETGSYPGQPWLWLYALWYQVEPFKASENADILVMLVMGVLSLAFICIPFIPIVNRIPRWIPIYKTDLARALPLAGHILSGTPADPPRGAAQAATFTGMSGEESTPETGSSEADTIRIVLADDHAVVRSGLRHAARQRGRLRGRRRGQRRGQRAALRARPPPARARARSQHARRVEPRGDPAIRAESPDTQIVVLTMQQEPAFAREALGAGAIGYVLKEAADDELVEAVRRAAAGESYLNPGWARGSPPSRRRARRTTSQSARSMCCA